MSRFAEHVDLKKIGIVRLDVVGAHAVSANGTLQRRGLAGRFAVAKTKEHWVDSVHDDYNLALTVTRKLSAI